MNIMSNGHGRSFLYLSFFGASMYGVFCLPWNIPLSHLCDSQSFVFGFNNQAAILSILVSLASFFILNLCATNTRYDKNLESMFHHVSATQNSSKAVFFPTVILTILAIFLFWKWLPYGYFGETAYFLTRLDLVNMGLLPFKDFEYGYGLAGLGFPYLIHILSFRIIPLDTAYILNLLLFYFLGLCMLFGVIQNVNISAKWKSILFILFALGFFNLTMGVQYTPIRFIFPLWAMFPLCKSLAKPVTQASLTSFFISLAGCLLGPEVALITLLSSVTALFMQEKRQNFFLTAVFSALALPFVLMYSFFGPDVFRILFSFGGGAYNFPVLPAPFILMLLLMAFWILPINFSWVVRNFRNPRAPLLAACSVAAGLFLPAAFGRCDPGHVLLNGTGTLLLGLFLGISTKEKLKEFLVFSCFSIVLITFFISFWIHYKDNFVAASEIKKQINEAQSAINYGKYEILKRIGNDQISIKQDWEKKPLLSADMVVLLPLKKIAVAQGGGEDLDKFLKLTGKYFPVYHVPPFDSIFRPQDAQKKSEQLNSADVILFDETAFLSSAQINSQAYAQGWSNFLSGLFVFPVNLSARNSVFNSTEILRFNISNNFRPIGKFRNYLILLNNRQK